MPTDPKRVEGAVKKLRRESKFACGECGGLKEYAAEIETVLQALTEAQREARVLEKLEEWAGTDHIHAATLKAWIVSCRQQVESEG